VSTAKEAIVDTATSAKDKVATYLAPRQDYNNKTKEMLRQYGSGIVTKAVIMRKPVDAYITTVLNLVSLGKWNNAVKKEGFDKFFHLCLICTVNNEELNVEKLDVVSISKNIYTGDTVEIQDVPLDGREFTLNQLLETARENVGDEAFFYYDSFQNNCQSFVSYLLKGQGLYRPAEKAFTYQAIEGVIDDMPDYVKRFQRGLTDIAASFNKLSGQGEDIKENKIYRQPYARPDEMAKNRRQPYRPPISGSGIEDFVKDKGLELASGFADSLGGENFLGQVQEDITDVFSGRRIGDSQRERADAQRLASQARDREDREFIKNNPIEAEALQWAGERQTNLQQELFGQFQTKFPSEENPYGAQGYPYDAMNFSLVSQRKGFKTKAQVEKFYQKVRKESLQTLKKGSLAEAEKKYMEQEAKDQKLMKQQQGSGNPFVDLGNKAVASASGSGIGYNQPNPYGDLHELERQFGRGMLGYIDELEGGNQASGFIRAMMARRFPQGQKGDKEDDTNYKEINKKKFKNLDNKGFDIKKMSKTTHNLALTSKPLTTDEIYKSFYDYIVQHAPQHLPIRDGDINYKGTHDLERMFELWKETVGVEKRQGRKERKDAPPVDVDIPASFYDLPKPKVAVNSPAVVVVPVEDVDDEKGDKVVLGEFEDPKNAFEREINKLVNYGATYLHFNDFIANVLKPVANPETHSGASQTVDLISMYYFITKYKIPILKLGTTLVYVPKKLDQKVTMYAKDFTEQYIQAYNAINNIPDVKDVPQIIEEIKKNIDRGEPQVLLTMGIGTKSAGYHTNAIIIRAVDKKVYIVDPHGEQEVEKYSGQYKKQLAVITKIAKSLKYTVIPSGESCPYPSFRKDVKRGFQAIENLLRRKEGFCGWWSFFIIEMCCLKPDIPFEALYEEAKTLLSSEPQKIFNVIVKYQYNLQQIVKIMSKEVGITADTKIPIQNLYAPLAVILSDKIGELLVKRKDLLGYGKLEGDGSRGYNFIRALNASKAPANTESESIVKWREEHKEDADKINEGKFGKFDYSKLKKGTRDLAKRTENFDPKKGYLPIGSSGLYDLKKRRKELQYNEEESARDRNMYHRFSIILHDWRGYYLENWSDLSQKKRKDAYGELAELIHAKKDPTYLGKVVLDELKTVNDFDEFDYKALPANILKAFAKWLNKQ
jgi:hypothetical protein